MKYEEYLECKEYMKKHPNKHIWWQNEYWELEDEMKNDPKSIQEKQKLYRECSGAKKWFDWDYQWWLEEFSGNLYAKIVIQKYYETISNTKSDNYFGNKRTLKLDYDTTRTTEGYDQNHDTCNMQWVAINLFNQSDIRKVIKGLQKDGALEENDDYYELSAKGIYYFTSKGIAYLKDYYNA